MKQLFFVGCVRFCVPKSWAVIPRSHFCLTALGKFGGKFLRGFREPLFSPLARRSLSPCCCHVPCLGQGPRSALGSFRVCLLPACCFVVSCAERVGGRIGLLFCLGEARRRGRPGVCGGGGGGGGHKGGKRNAARRGEGGRETRRDSRAQGAGAGGAEVGVHGEEEEVVGQGCWLGDGR